MFFSISFFPEKKCVGIDVEEEGLFGWLLAFVTKSNQMRNNFPLFVVLKQDCYRRALLNARAMLVVKVDVQHQNSSLVLEFFISFSTLFFQHSHTDPLCTWNGESIYFLFLILQNKFFFILPFYISGRGWWIELAGQDNTRREVLRKKLRFNPPSSIEM